MPSWFLHSRANQSSSQSPCPCYQQIGMVEWKMPRAAGEGVRGKQEKAAMREVVHKAGVHRQRGRPASGYDADAHNAPYSGRRGI